MSEHTANSYGSGHLRRLRDAAVLVLIASSLGACASVGIPGLGTSTSLAPADTPVEAPKASVAGTSAQARAVAINLSPIIGAPGTVTGKLSQKLESELANRNINVVKGQASYKLRGIVSALSENKLAKIAYIWDLNDGAGKRQQRIAGEAIASPGSATDPWAGVSDRVLSEIASTTAEQLASWIAKNGGGLAAANAPAAPSVAANRIPADGPASTASTGNRAVKRDYLAMVVPVTGAPGDGSESLTRAMRDRLRAKGIKLTSQATDSVYQIRGTVKVGDAASGQQPIQIDWRIYAPNGKRLDGIVQKNKLPAGTLDGAWGQIADLAAEGAADDIILVLSKSTAQL